MAFILDNGSGLIKTGSECMEPNKMFPTLVGRPCGNKSELLVGDQALEYKEAIKLNHPIRHGIVENWDEMEKIWEYALGGKAKSPVLITETANAPFSYKQKSAELFFEKFKAPSFYVAMQETLSLYASGRVTGVVLTCGDGVTTAVPIYEGYAPRHAIQRSDVAGRDVTEYLQMLLRKGGYNFHTSNDFEIVKNIKETLCYLALDLEKEEMEPGSPPKYELPDQNVINVGAERFRAPEVLFNPALLGREDEGVHRCLESAVMASDLDLHRILCANIVLAGGSTKLTSFGEVLFSRIKDIFQDLKIQISSPKSRHISAFTGGAVLTSMPSFEENWITKKQYKEEGARALLKCR